MAWINQRIPLASDQQRDICIAYHACLQSILRGHGTDQAWHTLACSLNIAMMLCEQGFNAGKLDTIKQAQQAMLNCRARAARHGSYGFTGDEARLLMEACNAHDEQIATASKAQVSNALRDLHRRIEAGEVLEAAA
jgi:hypothetical protein